MADRSAIEGLLGEGDTSYRAVAERYGVSKSALIRYRRHDAGEGRL